MGDEENPYHDEHRVMYRVVENYYTPETNGTLYVKYTVIKLK